MAEKLFSARDIVFREGDMADMAYIIREGVIEILKHGDHGEIKLAELKAGEIFGEMGLFDPKSPRSATARAQTNAILDIISEQELHDLIGQCPPRLIPIIGAVFERLRVTNTRIKKTEQATVLLESDIEKIVVHPGSADMPHAFSPVEMPVAYLPLRIGGYLEGKDIRRSNNHIQFPSHDTPLIVSTNHCEVAVQDGKIYVRDLGSRFGTTINNHSIGRGKGEYKSPLQKGSNLVIVGDKKTSPYSLRVECI